MAENFVVKKVIRRRRRLVAKTDPVCSPSPVPTPAPVLPKEKPSEDTCGLPEYLINPPETPDEVCMEDRVHSGHTNELICSFRIAKEILGSSFRPKESNLAVGNIRV